MKPNICIIPILLSLLMFFSGCKEDNNDGDTPKPEVRVLSIRAADISFLPEIEDAGTTFYDSTGTAKDVITILNENGCNTVRIRIWHTPVNDHSGIAEVVQLANRVREKNMKVWLDIHYSDTWADPGHQKKPAAWESLNTTDLTDSVYNYTRKVIQLIAPEYVQIGNEINTGFLWNNGSTNNQSDFILLLKSGIKAVRDNSPFTKIILHIAGYSSAIWFFDVIRSNSVDYDIIGISYYPAWHGKNLTELQNVLNSISKTNKKPYVIAETAYPFTLDYNDWTNNTIGLSEHLISGYPASESGQKNFLLKIKSIITTSDWGEGFCYWAPEWVAFKGQTATDGSSWENMTLFDFNNRALKGMVVFNP